MAEDLKPNVAVIGAGCAGMAAAATLTSKGLPVTVFEVSRQLGGRARAVSWKGQSLDNGQHILLGAYSETLRLLKLANVNLDQALLRLPLQLQMHGRFALSACSVLPAPLHILAGLLFAKGISLSERMQAIRFMIWMRLANFRLQQDEALINLLTRKHQSKNLIKLLWEPLCLAALNTPLHCASAQVYLNVLRDSFANSKADSDMLLPRHDLSALLAEPLAVYIKNRNGQIRTNSPIVRIDPAEHGFNLKTADGTDERFTHVIVAAPPFRLSDLVGHLPALADTLNLCEQFSYQPIYTVYLQYPETFKLSSPIIGFAQGYSQWVFDRGILCGQQGLLAVVISAEGVHQKLTQEHLAQAVAQELSVAFPELQQPLWHKVVAEKRATFASTPDLPRPITKTAVSGLYLAGDYTAGDYPATIEGAVRSGIQCANQIISSQ